MIKSHLVVWQHVKLLLLWLWHLPLLLRVHLLVGLQQREDHGATRVRVVVVPEKGREKYFQRVSQNFFNLQQSFFITLYQNFCALHSATVPRILFLQKGSPK